MGWKETAKQLELLGKYFASVGWHDTAKYPDGTQVAVAAVSAEYGNVKMNVPPRPIVRPTIEQQSAEWSRQAALGIKAVAMGTRTAEQVITALGELAAGDVRHTITKVTSPELAESTKKRRERMGYKPDKPLVRSGLMLSTCTSEVEKK